MADGLNRVLLIGNLGKDVVFKVTSGNKNVAEFSMATTESWKDASGERQSSTEWHKIVVWGAAAEPASKILRKGSKVFVEGALRTRKWTDQEGKDHYTTEINCTRWIALDGKPDGATGHAPYENDNDDLPRELGGRGLPDGGFSDPL